MNKEIKEIFLTYPQFFDEDELRMDKFIQANAKVQSKLLRNQSFNKLFKKSVILDPCEFVDGVRENNLKFSHFLIWADKKLALALLAYNCALLEFASKSLRANEVFILAAFKRGVF